MQDADFEWDDEKAAENHRKHGIRFEDVRTAHDFTDSTYLERPHWRHGELRYQRIGPMHGGIVVVVYTITEAGRTRLISAREAESSEARLYHRRHGRR